LRAATVQTAFGSILHTPFLKEPDREPAGNHLATVSATDGQIRRKGQTNDGNSDDSQLIQSQRTKGKPQHDEPHIFRSQVEDPHPSSSLVDPRTYRNEFFEIKKSLLAGYGAFALQDLKWGQTILIERALFHANNITLFDKIDKLTPSNKQAFERMHAHSIKPGHSRVAAIFRTNRYVCHLPLTNLCPRCSRATRRK
jgi:hypothetical protein